MKQKGKVKKKVGKFAKDSFRQSMQRTTPHVCLMSSIKETVSQKRKSLAKEKVEHTETRSKHIVVRRKETVSQKGKV
jgi:hypothetical protein